jgi:hypothetical protein
VGVSRELVIGRKDADVTIDDPELSRRHLAVRPLERGVEVEDLGSRNGTFVNGSRLTDPLTLTVAGTISAGSTEIAVELPLAPTRVRDVPAAAPPAAAPPPPAVPPAPAAPPAEPPHAAPPPAAAPPEPPPAAPPPGPPAAPPAAAAPPAEPPHAAPPPAAPPPAAAPRRAAPPPPLAAPARRRAPRRRRPVWIPVVAVVALLAAIAVAAVLLLGGDDETTEVRPLNMDVATAVLSEPGPVTRIGGIATSEATGRMAVVVIRRVQGQPTPGGGPVDLRLDVTFSKPQGSFVGIVSGTVRVSARGVEIVRGRAPLSNGSGEFEGIDGFFRIVGNNPPGTSISRFKVRGEAEF